MTTAHIFIGFGGTLTGLILLYLSISILQEVSLNPQASIYTFFKTRAGIRSLRVMTAAFALYSVGMLIATVPIAVDHNIFDELSKFFAGTSMVAFVFFQYLFLQHIRFLEQSETG